MSKKVDPLPKGRNTLNPHLSLKNASKAIEFYKQVFHAQELSRFLHKGKILHAELKIGDSVLFIADEFPDPDGCGISSPQSLLGTTVMIHLNVMDVDSYFNRAIKAGAKVLMPLDDMFWGDRYGQIEDPFGHRWSLSTHIKDLSEEEIKMRAQETLGPK